MNFSILYLIYIFIIQLYAQKVEILMPNVSTTQEDAYMCTSYKILDGQSYITQIEPLTNMNIAHHMFAFGCEKPFSSNGKAWECGSNVCAGEKTILFAWARNAPTLVLPDDVAFKVGSETKHRYIVINVHYLDKVKDDQSGVAVTFTDTPRTYTGGIMILVTGAINIPPNTKEYHTDISCKYTGRPITVFAFRVHAHSHGDVNSAYRVRNHEWKQLAKGDPQDPQAFYQTKDPYDIKANDILLGRCVYHNQESRYVGVGPTHNDEMCNVYLMYYTDGEDNIQDSCAGSAYPSLETIIPDESLIKPPKPVNEKDNKPMQHHEMEGMSNKKTKPQQQQQQYKKKPKYEYKIPDLSSIYNNFDLIKPKRPIGKQDVDSSFNDDYYDDVDRGRSKDPFNNDNSLDYNNNNQDYSFDFDSNSDDLDYPVGSLDQASTSSLYSAINSQKNIQQKKKPNTNTKVSISKYTIMKSWYDQNQVKLGQVGGVAVDSVRGNIIIFHRGSQTWQYDSFNQQDIFNTKKYSAIPEDTIVVLNSNTGKLVKSWGANIFYMPHGITVDPVGNVWVTDVARHQVFKFLYNDTSRPVLEIGEKNVPGSDKNHFCKPADVAVFKNGDFFVADGYCNSRIIKFNQYGNYITEWSSDEQGKPGHFNIPHALALHEDSSILCVADRENYRIQCFDVNGNFMHQSVDKEYGPIYGISFAANNGTVLYAINGYAAGTVKQYEKKVVLIQVTDGSIMATISVDQSEVVMPHAIAINGDASEIYIGTLTPGKVVKYSYLSFTIDTFNKRKQNLTTSDLVKIDNVDGDKENFRTSMFIMAFLAIPLTIVVFAAIIIRLKNSGGNIRNLGNILKEPSNDLGKWLGKKNSKNIRNGFTRLNQDSENENEPLDNNDDSDDSDEIVVPITKA